MERRSSLKEDKIIICDGTKTLHHSQLHLKLWVMAKSIKVCETQNLDPLIHQINVLNSIGVNLDYVIMLPLSILVCLGLDICWSQCCKIKHGA
jgi:hypothetical protein